MITRILQLSARVASNAWVEVGVGADADIFVADRGGKREERATFGRRAPGQQRSIHLQEPSWLGGVDLAIWETQRCAIPLCGFGLYRISGRHHCCHMVEPGRQRSVCSWAAQRNGYRRTLADGVFTAGRLVGEHAHTSAAVY